MTTLEPLNYKFYYSKMIAEGKLNEPEAPPKEVKKLPSCEKQLWRKYRRLVWKITEKQNLKKLPNFDKRGFTNYHLDHKVSIWYGYKHKLDPKLIGGIDNLELIPYKENMLKATKSNFKGAKCLQTVMFV